MSKKQLSLLTKKEFQEQVDEVRLRRRVAGIYRGQVSRARKFMDDAVAKAKDDNAVHIKDVEPLTPGAIHPGSFVIAFPKLTLDYTQDQLSELVRSSLRQPCPCCDKKLTIENFVLDHKEPITRGGSFHLDNLIVLTKKCNRLKGEMTWREYLLFKSLIEQRLPGDVVTDIYRRMRLGSNAMSANQGRFKRKG